MRRLIPMVVLVDSDEYQRFESAVTDCADRIDERMRLAGQQSVWEEQKLLNGWSSADVARGLLLTAAMRDVVEGES